MSTCTINYNSNFTMDQTLRASDPCLYHPENINSLIHLIEVDESEFPFTEETIKTLQTAQKTDRLIGREYLMNYVRFFIGAAFGVLATALVASKMSKVSPSLLTGVGAAVSGSLGLAVTAIRSQNLAAAPQTRAFVITSLLEKHMRVGFTLIKMNRYDPELAKSVAEQLQDKMGKLEKQESFYGLQKKDILYLASPIQEALNNILDKKAPLYPLLDCATFS